MNKTPVKIFLPLAIAAALAFALAAGSARRGVIPEVKFSHNRHVVGQELECATCHENVETSESGKDDLLASKEQCALCHDVEDTNNCGLCHTKVDEPASFERIADYSPKFNHAVHLERGVACETCHAGISESDSSFTQHLPAMETCMHCHDGLLAKRECLACHENPKGKIPADHLGGLWMRQHGDDAKLDNGAACNMCHDREQDCLECHQGDNLLKRVHPRGYEFKHPLDIRSGRVECASCHESRNFCAECHQERNVYPRSHQRAGWANRTTGGRHAVEARIDVEQCTSCHGEETETQPVCAACHGQ